MVAARHIAHHHAEVKAKGCVNEAYEQIAAADSILLNKADLVEKAELAKLEKRLQSRNPTAPVHTCERCAVPRRRRGGAGRRAACDEPFEALLII